MFDDEGGLEFQDKLKNTYGSACRIRGPFGATELWVSDPRALQEILVKGHDSFREPDWFTTWLELVFGPVVATVYGHQHKIQRKILNPVFTTNHVRNYAYHDNNRTKGESFIRFVEILKSEVETNETNTEIIDIFKWVHLVSLEIIGQAGIGHSFGILEGNVPDYLAASRDFFALMAEMWYFHPFITFFSRIGTASFRRAIVEWIPHRPVQRIKNVSDTMHKTAVEIMRHKREAMHNGTLDSEVAAGKDIMTALLRQNLVVAPHDQMKDEEILSQVNGLAFAGHDTTSSALSQAINMLAEYQEVQTKLRDELRTAHRSYGKNLDYDQLNSLSYLDAVCRECLRLHAPGAFAIRVATEDWTLPLHYPVKTKDEKVTLSKIRIPKGTTLHIALRAANRDERTWGADAEEFKPERWLEPLPASVSDARMPGIYSSMMTFLGGPRGCPGMKFSQLEMKIVISRLVSSFSFHPSGDAIRWKATGIAKPHVQRPDGKFSETPMMPIRVTVLEETE
ncbi:cytochrome p450, partial [Rhizoctonia solani]